MSKMVVTKWICNGCYAPCKLAVTELDGPHRVTPTRCPSEERATPVWRRL